MLGATFVKCSTSISSPQVTVVGKKKPEAGRPEKKKPQNPEARPVAAADEVADLP